MWEHIESTFGFLKMVLILEHPKRKAKSDIRTKKF